MLSDLEERFGLNPLKVSLEACASALDPRFHRFKEFEAEERDAVYGKIRTCLQLPGASDDPQTQTAASSDGEPPLRGLRLSVNQQALTLSLPEG